MRKKVLIGLAIVIVLVIGIAGKIFYDDLRYQQRASEAMNSITEETAKPSDIDYNSLGKYGPFVKDFGDSYVKMMADIKKAEETLQQPEFQEILGINYLKNPSEGKKKVKTITDTLNSFQENLKQDFELIGKSLESAPLNATNKQEIAKVVATGKDQVSQIIDPIFKLTSTLMTKVDSVFDFLLSKQGKYSVEGNQIQFNSQQDVDTYNNMIQDIQSVAKELQSEADKLKK